MSIVYKETNVIFEGICSSEQAEKLREWLEMNPKGLLDFKNCQHIHSSVLQVLMAAHSVISVPPDDPYLRDWVMPSIVSG